MLSYLRLIASAGRCLMKKVVLISTGAIIAGCLGWSAPALAQGKTAKACTEEWRADKANFQAKGITEKAYVAQCRAGAAATAAPAPAPPLAPPPPIARAPDNSAGVKTAKACTQEWRADKANFQAKGITERAYVAACRAGTAPTATAAPGPAPAPAAPPPVATAPESGTGAKTAKACTEEWRADKANFQAKGITERAYVAACRAGTVATPTVAPAPAPTTTTAAPPPPAPPPAREGFLFRRHRCLGEFAIQNLPFRWHSQLRKHKGRRVYVRKRYGCTRNTSRKERAASMIPMGQHA
jgi:hypothetical protein